MFTRTVSPQNEVQKAVSVLVKCVYCKFASATKSPNGEVLSLATISSEQEGVDAVALYHRLLSQPLPYDYKCPALMPGVTPHNLGREKLFLWLSYWYVEVVNLILGSLLLVTVCLWRQWSVRHELVYDRATASAVAVQPNPGKTNFCSYSAHIVDV